MNTKTKNKLEWLVVKLGEDLNWWVVDISDKAHWDTEGLSILDPRQFSHILELADPLREYGLPYELFEEAFIPFKIEKEVSKGQIRLTRSMESLLESEDSLFALPNNVDDDKSPFADLIDHLTRARVQMLNDLIEFEESLTEEELEEDIREQLNAAYFEGHETHVFQELTLILEYVPAGYELDADVAEEITTKKREEDEDFPDIEEDEEEIEADETMKWDDDEEEDEDDYDDEDEEEGDEDYDEDEDDEDDEEEDEDYRPRRGR